MGTDFSSNLRNLCTEKPSITHVCREVGINRQQFNRYLSGEGLPSAYNLRRICNYFGLKEADLFLSCDRFEALHALNSRKSTKTPINILSQAFPGNLGAMRRYLGVYYSHFFTPSWDGQILKGLVMLYERDGYVISRSVERGTNPERSIRFRVRFDGLASYRSNRIFIVESEHGNEGSMVETILFPAHRQQISYLRGMTMGVAWRPRLMPYSSRTIWQRVSERTSAREALKRCGVFPIDSRSINKTVRDFLSETDYPNTDMHSNSDFF